MAAKATILCVEDEGLLLEDIREELEDAGYDVLTAPDGKVAIERIGEKKGLHISARDPYVLARFGNMCQNV